MSEKVEALRRAITDAGPVPEYHRTIMARHRREWPTLWQAIDALLAVERQPSGRECPGCGCWGPLGTCHCDHDIYGPDCEAR